MNYRLSKLVSVSFKSFDLYLKNFSYILKPITNKFIGIFFLGISSVFIYPTLISESKGQVVEICSNSPDFLRCMRAYKGLPPLPSQSKGGPIAIKVIPFYQGVLPPIYKKSVNGYNRNGSKFKRGISKRKFVPDPWGYIPDD